MLKKLKINKICLFCKKKIKNGDKIKILSKGVVLHNDPCFKAMTLYLDTIK